MRRVSDVIFVTDVDRFRIVLTIRWVIAQWLHLSFGTFVDHDGVVIARGSFNPDFLENVNASIDTVRLT
jgi:hypothetical protein